MQAAKDIERLREIVTAEFPPVNKQLLLIWKAESVTPILTKAIDEWIEVIDKKRPMIDITTYHEAIALTGDQATAIKADGGTVGDVRSYFENVDTSNLPPSAAVYLREQLLTDPKLKDFDPENETFKLLKSAIDGINKKHTIVKTEEFIDLPEEQMQQRAVRKVEPPVVELPIEKPVIVAAPVNLDEEEPEIDERAIVEEQIADYQAAVKYLTGTDKETMETAIADLKIALKYLPEKKAIGGFFTMGKAKRPKSALMRDRKYTSQQEWEVDYPRKKRRKFYKEAGGEVEGEEEKIGLDLPDYKRVYLMFDYLKKTYPDYTDAKMSGDPEYDDSERGNENYNDVFFEMIDDLRETYLTEEEENWANTLVEQYMAGDTSVAQVDVKSDFFPTGEATAFYLDGKFVGVKYVIEQGDFDIKKRTKYTVWFFDLPENKTLEEFLAEVKAGKHKVAGTRVTGNWDKVQKEIKTATGNLKSGGKLKRNLSRDRQFVSHQEWELNYDRKVNAKHYKADGGAFDTDLLFQGGTMADLKRKLGLGTAVKLVNWQGKTDPAANPNIGVTRYVVKAQSNSVAFNADKNAKSGSWWEFPPASLVEITPTGFKVYEPARRPLNAEEQAIMDKQPVDAEQQQIDVMTDGSVMYYRRKDYFENSGYGYLYNHNWEKGKLYSNGVVMDKSIKGNLALEYEFVDERSGGGRAKQQPYAEGYKEIKGVKIVADEEFDDNPLFYVWSEYPKNKKLDHRGYLQYSYEFYNDKSGNKYLVISDPKEATDEELLELITKANWDDARNVDGFVEGADKEDYVRWLRMISKNGGELSSEKTIEGTPGYEAVIYYKDEPTDFKSGYLFSEGDSSEDDDSIFFYVKDEEEMKSLMNKENEEDFVVVSYEPTKLFKKGGRLKSAINRDRKYTSQQEWEKDYHRQGRRKFYKAEGGELTAEAIPVLSESATWEDVKKYLLWLKDSEYAYHIDDNPYDIVTFTEPVAAVLKANSDILWKHASDKMGTNLWEVYFPDTEFVEEQDDVQEPGFIVMNITDGIHASPEVYKTRAEAEAFVKNFPKRFKLMGYYLTARQERIKPEDVVLEIVPVGKHIWQIPRDKFVKDVVSHTDAFQSYPSSITDNAKIVAVYHSPHGGTNEFNITRPTATKAKKYANMVHEWVVQQALNDGENIPAEVMKDYPKMVKTSVEPVEQKEPVPAFKEYFSEIGDEVKGYVSNWSTGGTKYKGLPVVYGVTEHEPGSFMIVSGILKDNILLSTTEAYDDWFGNQDDALRVAHEIATNVDAVFKKGGRLKSAINRDRKYTSQQEWEKRYGRAGRRKFYKGEGGGFDDNLLKSGGKVKDDPNDPYSFVIKEGDKAYINDKKDPLYLTEGKVTKIIDVKGEPHAEFEITHSTNPKWKKGEHEFVRVKHLTKMRDLIGIEFPGEKFNVPYFVTVENGFEDTSWHNDETASFTNTKYRIKLWVYPADAKKRSSDIKSSPSAEDQDAEVKQYVIQPCDAEGSSVGADLLLTNDEREAGNFFEEYKNAFKYKVKYELFDSVEPGQKAIGKGTVFIAADSASEAEQKAIAQIKSDNNGRNVMVSVKSVLKTLETGGSFSKFLSKATDIAHKGVAGAKKGYERANKYAHDKVREKKRDIAWEVLQETRGIVDKKKDSILLNEASNLVEQNYKGGGEVKTKKRGRPATPHILPATNFDVRISRKLANELLDKDDELISSDGCEIYCKELGTKPGVWQQCLATDLINHKLPTKYKTFEVWCTGKLSKEECLNKLKLFIIANNLK